MNAVPTPRQALQALERVLVRFASAPVRLRGLALCRIALGLAGVDLYLANWSQRNLLWGPHGYISSQIFALQVHYLQLHSLYQLASSPAVFQTLYLTGLLVAALFMVFGGRTLALAHAIFLWSLYQRNGELLDGGDNLARIVIIFMVFVISDAYYSPHASWRRERLGLGADDRPPKVKYLFHNAAVLLVTFQIGMLYFCAGAWKVAGSLWQNGTAMYYVTNALDFRFLSLGSLTHNAIIVTLLTYFAIAANLGFPVGLFTKRLRYVTVAMAMMMHFGIVVVMGLTGFGITMIGADLGCLSDAEYEQLREFARSLLGTIRRRRREPVVVPGVPLEPALEGAPESGVLTRA